METDALQGLVLQLRTARIEAGTYLVEVDGDLDLHSAPDLGHCLDGLIETGARVLIVDLARTSFVDSTGLGVLIAGTKLARLGHGELHIVDARPAAAQLFDVTGMNAFLSVLPKVSDALALA